MTLKEQIVNDINATGGKAKGLPGHKQGLISVEKLKIMSDESDSNIEKLLDLGFVGKPTDIDAIIIEKTISEGLIPVISPLGRDKKNNI